MDEEISIINSRNRSDKIKNFLINNRNKIIGIFFILLIIVLCFYIFENYKINKKVRISDNYNSLTMQYSDNQNKDIGNKLIEIINEKDPTYSPLSLYFIIDNEIIKDRTKINGLFDILINKTSLDSEIKNLVIYKKALFNADNSSEGDLLSMLKPIINSNSIWKSHALYLIAEYFYAQNQNQKAKEFFNQIISLEHPNPNIKFEVEKRLNRDLSE